jgi:hypothetical protein
LRGRYRREGQTCGHAYTQRFCNELAGERVTDKLAFHENTLHWLIEK